MFKDFYLNIELIGDVKPPVRANDPDAGIDVYSPEEYIIPAGKDILIPLNLKVEFPSGYAMIFKEKSGRAVKNKLHVGACVVDAGYENIVHAHMFNAGSEDVIIKKNEKLVQFIIIPVWNGQPSIVKSIASGKSSRGQGGFGSSGL